MLGLKLHHDSKIGYGIMCIVIEKLENEDISLLSPCRNIFLLYFVLSSSTTSIWNWIGTADEKISVITKCLRHTVIYMWCLKVYA